MTHLALSRVLLLTLVALAVPVGLLAKTEMKYNSGPCTGVDAGAYAEWYSVTILEDGKPTEVFGRGCDGKYYRYRLGCRIITTDPISGPLAHTGSCDLSNAVWRCEIRYNDNRIPNWIGGQDCAGEYYIDDVMTVEYPEKGGSGGTIQ